MGYTETEKDNDLTICLEAAVDYVERNAWTALTTKTITQTYDYRFPCIFSDGSEIMYLAQPPAQSVTSIQYIDPDGEQQTLAADQYAVDTNSTPARISPAYNVTWPDTAVMLNAVTVVFQAGYGASAADVPKIVKRTVIAIASDMFEHLESQSEISLSDNLTAKYSLDLISFRRAK